MSTADKNKSSLESLKRQLKEEIDLPFTENQVVLNMFDVLFK